MNVHTAERLIPGPVGNIDVSVDLPDGAPRGLALVGHPHPLFGGTKDNKVAQTLARTFVGLGYATVRLNFRGVGKTEGTHDNGIGEQDDMLAVLDWMRTQAEWSPEVATLPLALGGFSFGSFVVSQVARRLTEAGTPAERLALVGTATSRWDVAPVPADTIVIHGELDDTVPLADVLDWARPQELPVIVIPGADHFFHRKLHLIRQLIAGAWMPRP
ncbi:alpha/beta hydrolase [Ralstonia syzygii subsp. celebesensis]|uniref:Alpha/beta hydrolase n=3 Tax=Ralstonia solanacearum species complex TaxID=3116862 RepID=A0AAD0WH34_RALSL|nr:MULTISPECIES: alpha/beta hydrolase [Ralstonia solanacearum species complex]CCA80474.1 putative hydrolase (alpha/beta superfamily domain) [blood disease bacterium R229]AQW30007.1 alpha/beta hydrolase [blood disease bacterium A2-HR MARDI]AXV82743.1 alpha/beta hydrolase [Ralstonia solanacearum]AXW53863.1 alpha/beta hydrolase [Ralstonia solanacearum]QQV56160.1 alpha/beta hydrolase [Ralstonia syzygii subsp. celebesensis]